jgi:eukaryotic-like serine/threonine-protein kinase
LSAHADDPSLMSQLAESVANLGMLDDGQGHQAAAEQALTEAVALLRPIADSAAGETRYPRNLAIALNNLSYVVGKRDPAAAERAAREAIEILERVSHDPAAGRRYEDDLALGYNNLAELESRTGKTAEAIDWYGKAVALQEQMVRKAPGIVRSRSDLAISLNNLGMALCRNGRVDDSAQPFDRSRELMATLSGDYPGELTYQTLLAGLLNNQALALAAAGRHQQAVEIYAQGITAQRQVWERASHSDLMRELLSKMYYNEGQSLLVLGKLDEASSAALARRHIWQQDGERLVGVAAELAAIDRAAWAQPGPPRKDRADAQLRLNLDTLVIETLSQSMKQGGIKATDLAADERFAYLHDRQSFQNLINEQAVGANAASSATSSAAAHD